MVARAAVALSASLLLLLLLQASAVSELGVSCQGAWASGYTVTDEAGCDVATARKWGKG